MNLEEAIKTALDYEQKIRDTYVAAAKRTEDPVGQRVLKVLADEEQSHVDFLQACLSKWQTSKTVDQRALKTALPSKKRIAAGLKKVEKPLNKTDRSAELDLLKGALEAEGETSDFYRRLVAELPEGQRELFVPFVDIEVAHQAIVQAEIDSLTGNGFWFDFMEINLEAG